MILHRRHIQFYHYVALAFLVFLICPGTGFWNVYADEVMMTNGDRITGRLISLYRETARISTPHSGILETGREHIQQLNTENPMVVELVSGERVIGRIGSGAGKTIIIHSSTLGDIEFPLSAVASVCLPDEKSIQKTAENESGVVSVTDDSPFSRSSHDQNGFSTQLHDIRGKGSDTATAPESGEPHKPIGSKPEDDEDIRRIFLRQTSVLLNPGVTEAEIGLDYLANQFSAAIFNARFRRFEIPLGMRIGIIEGLEGFVSIPFTHAEQKISFAGDSVTQDATGIGDTLLGLNYEIFRETARRPDITTVLRIRAPTGEAPGEEELSTGSGHLAGSFGFQFTKTTDPVVLFWGIRYTHEFPATYFLNDGVHKVQPGDTIDYNFGFGFAVNDNVSLSAQVLGGYQRETELDGQKLSGSSGEPVSLRSALTYRVSRRTYLEPSLKIGLNDDTPDFVIGIAIARRFGN